MNNVAIINGKSSCELFTGTSIGANLKHYHVFGCLVFALDNALASGNSLLHWLPCACLGVNLGLSPDPCQKCQVGSKPIICHHILIYQWPANSIVNKSFSISCFSYSTSFTLDSNQKYLKQHCKVMYVAFFYMTKLLC